MSCLRPPPSYECDSSRDPTGLFVVGHRVPERPLNVCDLPFYLDPLAPNSPISTRCWAPRNLLATNAGSCCFEPTILPGECARPPSHGSRSSSRGSNDPCAYNHAPPHRKKKPRASRLVDELNVFQGSHDGRLGSRSATDLSRPSSGTMLQEQGVWGAGAMQQQQYVVTGHQLGFSAQQQQQLAANGEQTGVMAQQQQQLATSGQAGVTAQQQQQLAMSERAGITAQQQQQLAMSERAGITAQQQQQLAMSEQAGITAQQQQQLAMSEQAGITAQQQQQLAVSNGHFRAAAQQQQQVAATMTESEDRLASQQQQQVSIFGGSSDHGLPARFSSLTVLQQQMSRGAMQQQSLTILHDAGQNTDLPAPVRQNFTQLPELQLGHNPTPFLDNTKKSNKHPALSYHPSPEEQHVDPFVANRKISAHPVGRSSCSAESITGQNSCVRTRVSEVLARKSALDEARRPTSSYQKCGSQASIPQSLPDRRSTVQSHIPRHPNRSIAGPSILEEGKTVYARITIIDPLNPSATPSPDTIEKYLHSNPLFLSDYVKGHVDPATVKSWLVAKKSSSQNLERCRSTQTLCGTTFKEERLPSQGKSCQNLSARPSSVRLPKSCSQSRRNLPIRNQSFKSIPTQMPSRRNIQARANSRKNLSSGPGSKPCLATRSRKTLRKRRKNRQCRPSQQNASECYCQGPPQWLDWSGVCCQVELQQREYRKIHTLERAQAGLNQFKHPQFQPNQGFDARHRPNPQQFQSRASSQAEFGQLQQLQQIHPMQPMQFQNMQSSRGEFRQSQQQMLNLDLGQGGYRQNNLKQNPQSNQNGFRQPNQKLQSPQINQNRFPNPQSIHNSGLQSEDEKPLALSDTCQDDICHCSADEGPQIGTILTAKNNRESCRKPLGIKGPPSNYSTNPQFFSPRNATGR